MKNCLFEGSCATAGVGDGWRTYSAAGERAVQGSAHADLEVVATDVVPNHFDDVGAFHLVRAHKLRKGGIELRFHVWCARRFFADLSQSYKWSRDCGGGIETARPMLQRQSAWGRGGGKGRRGQGEWAIARALCASCA